MLIKILTRINKIFFVIVFREEVDEVEAVVQVREDLTYGGLWVFMIPGLQQRHQ